MEWIGKLKGSGGYRGNTDYDVMVTVVRNSRSSKTAWGGYALALVLRNKAFRIALSLKADTIKRSPIVPNQDRIYLAFEKKDPNSIGVKLTPGKEGTHYSCRFAFLNKVELETAKGVWADKIYPLQYDRNQECYYIDRGDGQERE